MEQTQVVAKIRACRHQTATKYSTSTCKAWSSSPQMCPTSDANILKHSKKPLWTWMYGHQSRKSWSHNHTPHPKTHNQIRAASTKHCICIRDCPLESAFDLIKVRSSAETMPSTKPRKRKRMRPIKTIRMLVRRRTPKVMRKTRKTQRIIARRNRIKMSSKRN